MGAVTPIRRRKAAAPPVPTGPARPMPLSEMGVDTDVDMPGMLFAPARDIGAWVAAHLLREDSPLFNPEHQHLENADIEYLWACAAFPKAGRLVLGQCEQVAFRAGGWQKLRQEAQMVAWFGRVPRFLVTLAADYCMRASDIEFARLLEHELFHIGHKRDAFGSPEFDQGGNPKLYLRGHDVEEFVGVVRRYGVPRDGLLRELIDAGNRMPEVGMASIANACGTCLERAA